MADASEIAETVGTENPRAPSQPFTIARRHMRWLWVAALCGAIVFLVWANLEGWPAPITATDIDQQRLNKALAPPAEGQSIAQTFRSDHDGLSEVEVLLSRSGPTAGEEGQITLRLVDNAHRIVSSRSWPTRQLQHNQKLVLRFSPQERSLGREYRLIFEGSRQNPFGLWAYDLDVHEEGILEDHVGSEITSGDLRFTTRYRLQLPAALQELGKVVRRDGSLLMVSTLLLFLPGCLTLSIAERRLPTLAVPTWWGLALATGLALWPLLWYWLTLAGGRWTRTTLILFLILGWLVVIAFRLRRGVSITSSPFGQRRRPWSPSASSLLLLGLIIVALGVRLLAVRDLAFPPWVDSSRHALITTIMTESGQTPADYRPYLALDEFSYHFGFHAVAAGVNMLSADSLPRVLLLLGQLLNALAPLSVYSGARLLTRRRSAALFAAFLVALPFFFPAYYVTWGRYTQLTGALLLAPLVALTWLLARGARGWRAMWWLVGLLASGQFLVHVRVFLVYLLFALLAAVAIWTRRYPLRYASKLLRATLLGLVLVAPRIWQLANSSGASGYLSPSGEAYAQFPTGYVNTGWERWFLALGGLGFLALTLRSLRPLLKRRRARTRVLGRQRRAFAAVALGGWAALSVLTFSGTVPSIPALWLINLNSAYILIFVPLALLLALAFDQTCSWLSLRSTRSWRFALHLVLSAFFGAAVLAASLFGARQQIDIVNETTILARPADRDALAWVDENLPADARVAVNSWRWLGATWAAGDGGAWILPLTGLATTTPPVDYIGDPQLFQRVIAFNEGAMAIEDWSMPQAADWLARQGVSHIFVGARGGFFDPAALARNPQLDMPYSHDGAFVFAVRG